MENIPNLTGFPRRRTFGGGAYAFSNNFVDLVWKHREYCQGKNKSERERNWYYKKEDKSEFVIQLCNLN